MHTLIITAHPAQYGFTHKIAEAYRKQKEVHGRTAEIVDLYSAEYQQAFLRFSEKKGINKNDDPVRTKMQAKISDADELVFVFPVWWGNMPAILKNFIDVNITSGFAYKHEKGGMQKLLQWKTARIFATGDGSYAAYLVLGTLMKLVWKYAVLGYCGINLKSFDVFTDMFKKKDDTAREKLLAVVRKRAGL